MTVKYSLYIPKEFIKTWAGFTLMHQGLWFTDYTASVQVLFHENQNVKNWKTQLFGNLMKAEMRYDKYSMAETLPGVAVHTVQWFCCCRRVGTSPPIGICLASSSSFMQIHLHSSSRRPSRRDQRSALASRWALPTHTIHLIYYFTLCILTYLLNIYIKVSRNIKIVSTH